MTATRTLIWANTLAFLATVIVNYLSNSLPLNGKTPGELSDQYPNLFVPDGATFSIWGIIYTGLLVWIVLQWVALFSARIIAQIEPAVQKIGWLFVATCFCNVLWLFSWHWELVGLSVVMMLNLLYYLYQINVRLTTNRQAGWMYAWTRTTFGVYQGWITVALIANVTALLVSIGWRGGDLEVPIAMGMILIGGALAIYMLLKNNNIGHAFAVAWAFWGIFRKQNTLDGHVGIAQLAIVLSGLLVVGIFYQMFRSRSL
jgi:hypothetical protein